MLKITVNSREAIIKQCRDPITSGSVGYPVEFLFSDDWDGLQKIVVFRGSGLAFDVPLINTDSTVIPHEVLTQPGKPLLIGVYGANGDGDVVIPTVYVNAGIILPGTEPSEVDPSIPTPSWAIQVQAIAQSVRDDADNGEFDGAPGAPGANGFSPTATVSKVGNTATITITDENGTTTAVIHDGPQGPAGKGVPTGGTTGQVLKKASGTDYDTEWADESGGSSIDPYTSTPAALGTASAGSSDMYSRGDHVHPMPSAADIGAIALPSDAEENNVLRYIEGAWQAGPENESIFWMDDESSSALIEQLYQLIKARGSGGLLGFFDRTNNRCYTFATRLSATKHSFFSIASGGRIYIAICENDEWTKSYIDIPRLATALPSALGTAAVGTSARSAREDHVHAMPSAADVGAIEAPSSASDGDFLTYNASTGAWVAQTVPSASGVSF